MQEKTINKNYIYKGAILNLRCDDVSLDEKTVKREIVEHNGGSAVLTIYGHEVVFVKQYRYAFSQELIEIPAGKIDIGETAKQAAERELFEETGLFGTVKELGVIYPSTGYTTEKIHLFYCVDAYYKGGQHTDEDEYISLIKISYDKAVSMAVSGELKDAKTIAALLMYDKLIK